MKKTAKTLLATLLALTMLCALALPVWADGASISNNQFVAYQIFKGTYDAASGKLSNIEWGDGVNYTNLLSDLRIDTTLGDSFLNATTARDVAEAMKGWKDSDEKSIAFARRVYKNKIAAKATPISGTSFTAKEAGYYLIVDKTPSYTSSYVAKNFSILKVLDPNTTYTIESKAVKPTVEKFVKNRNGDWAKYADYAIGDEIQFKLVATLPASSAYDFYDKYKFFFQDVLTAGFTYDSGTSVDRVTIAAGTGTGTAVGSPVVLDPNKYTLNLDYISNTTSPSFTVTIPDAKTADATITSEVLKTKGATIEVYYRAHLNTNAAITTYLAAPQSTNNTTDVQLFYYNDPHDSHSQDATPKDNVYVFTYGLEYTKYADKPENANLLGGAGFELHNATGAMTFDGSDVTYTYSKPSTNTTLLSSIAADTLGQFKVNGLAAGTYTLKETQTPAGYNTCADLTVEIKPAYTLAGDGTVTVNLRSSRNMSKNIINHSGVVLPSTGGMGTTLFYVIGGLLMVGAAVLLVTKKRMQKN